MCGGTFRAPTAAARLKGLSPRVRGNHCVKHNSIGNCGSIPACAGEPRLPCLLAIAITVYPRVCGGTSASLLPATQPRGLSPRVRGNRPWPGSMFSTKRSIPACAGEPASLSAHRGRDMVYPRVCGGTALLAGGARSTVGLSPRVRGNPEDGNQLFHRSRSIPACAGEPHGRLPARYASTVYPRVCGGTAFRGTARCFGCGLSPRVRGNRSYFLENGRRVRSIPACAGEPSSCDMEPRADTVYPRVCGGT